MVRTGAAGSIPGFHGELRSRLAVVGEVLDGLRRPAPACGKPMRAFERGRREIREHWRGSGREFDFQSQGFPFARRFHVERRENGHFGGAVFQ